MKNCKLGVMQGRLSPSNKIQEFPHKYWQNEFNLASRLGIKYIEWVLDRKYFNSNPFFYKKKKIKILSRKYNVKIFSLTNDYFMELPFWKNKKKEFKIYLDLKKIIYHASLLNIKFIVIPLLDNSSIKSKTIENKVIKFFNFFEEYLMKCNVNILFESDYKPKKLLNFIKNFNNKYFGINYDTGNSAFLGHNMNAEFKFYGKFIKSIHIKDKLLKGKSVRLGNGAVDFKKFFLLLKKNQYRAPIILQTARSKNKYISEIKENIKYLKKYF
jgi:L-ribulose-5-phosphate 3-epimerase